MATDRNVIGGELRRQIAAVRGCRTVFDEPLAAHASMGTGGAADAFCRAETAEGLMELLQLLAGKRVPWVPIGQGTNLLPADAGLRGAAIKLDGEFRRIEHEGTRLRSGAGAALSSVLERAVRHELGGLEFTVGIPGSVGGSLVGNAGTPEDSLGNRVETVELLRKDGSIIRAGGSDLVFSYRASNLAGPGNFVLGVDFRLDGRPRAECARMMGEFAEKRKDQPVDWPNSGCIFRNPPGFSAGRLIDEAGLKRARIGGAEVSERHANFIINRGGATTADVSALIERIRSAVFEKTGIFLEAEIVLLDESGRRLSLSGKGDPC